MYLVEKEIRRQYIDTFKDIYLGLKNAGLHDLETTAKELTEKKMKHYFAGITATKLESYALEAYSKYVDTGINVQKPVIMRGGKSVDWFINGKPTYSNYWPRYEKYLLDVKKWDFQAVGDIDESTNEILKSIGNPNLNDRFDIRGLVLGFVQSGKTANFTGLINKSLDVGYKVVIVLAGMHNDLRSQTQLRLEEEVVGIVDRITEEKKGVAIINSNVPQVETWTTVEKDISSSNTVGVRNLTKPALLVVKKNKDVLEALLEALSQSINIYAENKNVPVLFIDDEADQASVDTSNSNKNEDPKTINRLIRQLLELFDRKAYVGYTATPFANLLINSKGEHDEAGKDLYPKDFIIGLPKVKGYCGPEEYFNTTGYEEDDKPNYVRYLSEDDIQTFDGIKKPEHADLFTRVPISMKKAILSFLITVAIRNLRGQENQHNSMLIHTSRLKDVQSSMKDIVEANFEEMSRDILYNNTSETILSLEKLYYDDYVNFPSDANMYNWKNVLKEIKNVITKIKIMEINGNSSDALSYQSYKEGGLNVIAIGGDKLSRGLTLEGLSVSYYYRNSNMYDSLLQMGRWFGYRNGYLDLCRIYTSENIASNYEHLATVMVRLREEFEYMANHKMRPEDYAVKMLSHSQMYLTSLKKMGNADSLPIYQGTMQQTRAFEKQLSFYEKNMQATINFINEISQPFIKQGTNTIYHIAREVPSTLVKEFFKEYQTVSTARIVDSKKILSHIEKSNTAGELLQFNIAVIDITKKTVDNSNLEKFPVNLGQIQIESAVIRSQKKNKSKGDSIIDLGAIVAAQQNNIDLQGRGNGELRNAGIPLLLIYPLHPGVPAFKSTNIEFNEDLSPIGVAISFPKSEHLDNVERFVVNKTVERVR